MLFSLYILLSMSFFDHAFSLYIDTQELLLYILLQKRLFERAFPLCSVTQELLWTCLVFMCCYIRASLGMLFLCVLLQRSMPRIVCLPGATVALICLHYHLCQPLQALYMHETALDCFCICLPLCLYLFSFLCFSFDISQKKSFQL